MKATSSWLDDLKIRASWGQTGNQDISSTARYYIYVSNYGINESGGQSYGTSYDIEGTNGGHTLQSGFKRNQIGNDDIKWETTSQTNVGLDFSFFRQTIRQVKELLGDKALEPITGSVSAARRQEIVDEFTAAGDGTVLICQVQAGGTGLNIQAASVIIFCEPQIKPSIENQAVSRAYRMGQLRSVMVHRLLCDNTVDERILELLREKQDVFDSFAEESTVGSEYLRAEKSITAAIIEMEKERLASENPPEEA